MVRLVDSEKLQLSKQHLSRYPIQEITCACYIYIFFFGSSCTMGKLVMLVVIFVSVISLAVSRSSNFKKLSEKNLKRQYSRKYDFVISKTSEKIEFKITISF